jgi:hypothetical protein
LDRTAFQTDRISAIAALMTCSSTPCLRRLSRSRSIPGFSPVVRDPAPGLLAGSGEWLGLSGELLVPLATRLAFSAEWLAGSGEWLGPSGELLVPLATRLAFSGEWLAGLAECLGLAGG